MRALRAFGARADRVGATRWRIPLRACAEADAFYFAFGDHDAVVIVDLPDNEAAAAVALSVDAAGGATTKTTVLLTPEQVDDAAKRSVESVDYRPPGT